MITIIIIDVEAWTVNDVGEWLASTPQLEQYISVFALNEVNGNILMDITLEDLDYMDITVLAHRKTIIKSSEELKKYRKSTPRQLVSQQTQQQQLLPPTRTMRTLSESNLEQVNDSINKPSVLVFIYYFIFS
jgi:hypothetical protein